MKKKELEESLRVLKGWINDPQNARNFTERKNILNKINLIKQEIRLLTREETIENYSKSRKDLVNPNIQIETVIVEEDFTKKNVDNYRYHSLLKRLNDKYIKDNCKFKVGDLVKSGDKIGYIGEFDVYPKKVQRKSSGIYAKLLQRRLDGSKSQKTLRRSRLDDEGFPIEELEIYTDK